MDNFNAQAFPKNEAEFLTMLSLQNEDISGLSPEELVDRYLEIFGAVSDHLNQKTQPHYTEV